MNKVSILMAFTGGILSFISPCFLPLLPGYLSWITGQTSSKPNYKAVIIPVCSFILGFSVIFVSLGASATFLGSFIATNRIILSQISGVIIIMAGLSVAGLLKIPILNKQKSFLNKPAKQGSNFLLGMAFSLSWTPCIGFILSSILIYAANEKTFTTAILLLLAYSAGLGTCFLLSALLYAKLATTFSFIKKHYKAISVISGLLLVSMGLLLIFNQFYIVGRLLSSLPFPLPTF
ncbi:MAG: cytochrome c biogenesis protein CcdA [Actinobacteria bacterium]|nr:MAG: cytochrome c biogenesis protein CcdA [Actinomycetota bacterium]